MRREETSAPHFDRTPAAADDVIADVLGVPRSSLTDQTGFRSIPQWDSLRHVELMLALEELWQTEIGPDLVAELTTVAAIRSFAGRAAPVPEAAPGEPPLHRGLSGVYVDDTTVSSIDGEAGRLTYRGYSIDDLVEHSNFEETSYLLVHGQLPTSEELARFSQRLARAARVPAGIEPVLEAMRGAQPVDVLRTGVSALAAFDVDDGSVEAMVDAGIDLIGRVPALIAQHHAIRTGQRTEPLHGATHATRMLRALAGKEPTDREARTFDRCLILLAEHGSNASAFAGRVVIGTRGHLHAAVTAAIGAFAGSLHGGAIESVSEMIQAIGEPSSAAAWVRTRRASKEPVFGFGHRLYMTEDPRSRHLRHMAETLSREAGRLEPFLILEEVRRAMHAHTRYGIDVNVDLYAGLVFSLLGIPTDLFTPVFAASRTAGWLAQALEQRRKNVLIRPLLRYAGEDRRYTPIAERAAHGGAGTALGARTDRA